ncbi:hypothetical protein HEP73_03075 [Xanthomonas sp. GW]|nr:hypothetical protein HEP73_03075 [Xanthomonas sp. GW]
MILVAIFESGIALFSAYGILSSIVAWVVAIHRGSILQIAVGIEIDTSCIEIRVSKPIRHIGMLLSQILE